MSIEEEGPIPDKQYKIHKEKLAEMIESPETLKAIAETVYGPGDPAENNAYLTMDQACEVVVKLAQKFHVAPPTKSALVHIITLTDIGFENGDGKISKEEFPTILKVCFLVLLGITH
jgi:hypothetical protein